MLNQEIREKILEGNKDTLKTLKDIEMVIINLLISAAHSTDKAESAAVSVAASYLSKVTKELEIELDKCNEAVKQIKDCQECKNVKNKD